MENIENIAPFYILPKNTILYRVTDNVNLLQRNHTYFGLTKDIIHIYKKGKLHIFKTRRPLLIFDGRFTHNFIKLKNEILKLQINDTERKHLVELLKFGYGPFQSGQVQRKSFYETDKDLLNSLCHYFPNIYGYIFPVYTSVKNPFHPEIVICNANKWVEEITISESNKYYTMNLSLLVEIKNKFSSLPIMMEYHYNKLTQDFLMEMIYDRKIISKKSYGYIIKNKIISTKLTHRLYILFQIVLIKNQIPSQILEFLNGLFINQLLNKNKIFMYTYFLLFLPLNDINEIFVQHIEDLQINMPIYSTNIYETLNDVIQDENNICRKYDENAGSILCHEYIDHSNPLTKLFWITSLSHFEKLFYIIDIMYIIYYVLHKHEKHFNHKNLMLKNILLTHTYSNYKFNHQNIYIPFQIYIKDYKYSVTPYSKDFLDHHGKKCNQIDIPYTLNDSIDLSLLSEIRNIYINAIKPKSSQYIQLFNDFYNILNLVPQTEFFSQRSESYIDWCKKHNITINHISNITIGFQEIHKLKIKYKNLFDKFYSEKYNGQVFNIISL
jgi:hypothetical protein